MNANLRFVLAAGFLAWTAVAPAQEAGTPEATLPAEVEAAPDAVAAPAEVPAETPVEAPAVAEAPASTESPQAAAPADKVFGLVAVGDVDGAITARVKNFIEYNCAIPVRVLDPQARTHDALFDQAQALGGLVSDPLLCLVAVVNPPEGVSEHAVYDYDGPVAAVNVRALQPEDGDQETHFRRIEKVVTRSYALLMGLEAVPNPQSSLYPYATLAELDSIARSLDPPSLMKLQEILVPKGVTLVESSPFRLR